MYNGTETLSFLGPRIWEIVPDQIKKGNNLEELKFKIKLWNPENCPCRLCKKFYKLIFYKIPVIFYEHISSYLSHIFIFFKSTLNQFCILL